jgi:hypothetical protein
MPGDPTSARAERELSDRASDAKLDEAIAATVAGDTTPDAVVQAAREAGAVPVEADLEEAVAAAAAGDSVPRSVVQAAREAYPRARGRSVSAPTESDPARAQE